MDIMRLHYACVLNVLLDGQFQLIRIRRQRRHSVAEFGFFSDLSAHKQPQRREWQPLSAKEQCFLRL